MDRQTREFENDRAVAVLFSRQKKSPATPRSVCTAGAIRPWPAGDDYGEVRVEMLVDHGILVRLLHMRSDLFKSSSSLLCLPINSALC
jgi:hypothetical protein